MTGMSGAASKFTAPSGQDKYFSSIDGLRAFAVLLVLAFHAGFDWMQGGFVGVDVFFVISGFLITRILMRGICEGQFSFSQFFVRRIARLMPALFVTVFVTLATAIFILPPDGLSRLGQVSIYTILSGSNLFFWLESGYFDQGSSTKPFLHTWSLGVEEQFYLFWPVFLWACYKLRGVAACVIGLLVIGLLSLVFSLLLEPDFPAAVFFLTPFRIYQFALGALVALGPKLSPGKPKSILGLLAVAVILWIAISTSGATSSVLVNGLGPALFAALFIWCSEAKTIKIIFASVVPTWIGRRSYSIYLVHWPLMVLWPLATDFDLSAGDGVILIVVSVFVGAFLHALVEKRFRLPADANPTRRGKSLAFSAFFCVLGIVVGAHYWGNDGFPGRMPKELNEIAGKMGPIFTEFNKRVNLGSCYLTKQHELSDYDRGECATPAAGMRSYMVIGDSLASGAYMAFQDAYPEVHFGLFAKPGCVVPLPGETQKNPKKKFCDEYYDLAFLVLQEGGFDGVILSSNWLKEQDDKLSEFASWADRKNLDLIIIAHRPRFRERVRDVILSSLTLSQAEQKLQQLRNQQLKIRARRTIELFGMEMKVVDFYSIQCPDDCPIVDENRQILYYDGHHLTPAGAAWVAKGLRIRYPDILSSLPASFENH